MQGSSRGQTLEVDQQEKKQKKNQKNQNNYGNWEHSLAGIQVISLQPPWPLLPILIKILTLNQSGRESHRQVKQHASTARDGATCSPKKKIKK